MKLKKLLATLLCVALMITGVAQTALAITPGAGEHVLYNVDYDGNSVAVNYGNLGVNTGTVTIGDYTTTAKRFTDNNILSFYLRGELQILGDFHAEFDLIPTEAGIFNFRLHGDPDGTQPSWKYIGNSTFRDDYSIRLDNSTVAGYYSLNEVYNVSLDFDSSAKTYDAYLSGNVKPTVNGAAVYFDKKYIGTYNYPTATARGAWRMDIGSESGNFWFDNFYIALPKVSVNSVAVQDGITVDGTSVFDIDISRFIQDSSAGKLTVTKNGDVLKNDTDYTVEWRGTCIAAKASHANPVITLTEAVAPGDEFAISFAECTDDYGNVLGEDAVLEFECPAVDLESDTNIYAIDIDGVTVDVLGLKVTGMKNGIKASDLEALIEVGELSTVSFRNAAGSKLSEDDYLYDGDKIRVTADDGSRADYVIETEQDVYTYNFDNANNADDNIIYNNHRDAWRLAYLFPSAGAEYVSGVNPLFTTEDYGSFQNAFLASNSTADTAWIQGGKTGIKDDMSVMYAAENLTLSSKSDSSLLKDFYFEDGNIYAFNIQAKPEADTKLWMSMTNKYYNWKTSLEEGSVSGDKKAISKPSNFIEFNKSFNGSLVINKKVYDEFAAGNWFDVAVVLDMSKKDENGNYIRKSYFYLNGELVDTYDFSAANNTHNTFGARFGVNYPAGTTKSSRVYLDNIAVYKLYDATAPAGMNAYKLTSTIAEVEENGYITVPEGTTVTDLIDSLDGYPADVMPAVYNAAETSAVDGEIDLEAGNKLVLAYNGNVRSYTIRGEEKYTYKVVSGGTEDVFVAGETTITASDDVSGIVVAAVKDGDKLVNVYVMNTAETRTVTFTNSDASYKLEIMNVESLDNIAPIIEKVVYNG